MWTRESYSVTLTLRTWRTISTSSWVWRSENVVLSYPKAGEDECASYRRGSRITFPLLFVWSEDSTDWIVPTHVEWGQIFLTCPVIQMQMSSGTIFTDIPRTNALPAIWVSLNPVKLTPKISCHRCRWKYSLFLCFPSPLFSR